MATVKITPVNPKIKVGENATFTATVTDGGTDTLAFAWTKDGTPIGSSNTLEVEGAAAGTSTIKVVVTLTPESGAPTTAEDTTVLTVELKTMTATVTLDPISQTVRVGDTINVTSTINGIDAIPGVAATYSWSTGETTANLAHKATVAGVLPLELTVTLKAAGYKDLVLTETASATVENDIDTSNLRYIHPLDHRESAYLWCGWWVMDEIEKASKAGADWKDPDADLKYTQDLQTLAYMLETYPNIEVQESRHGYILNKEAIEAGYIY